MRIFVLRSSFTQIHTLSKFSLSSRISVCIHRCPLPLFKFFSTIATQNSQLLRSSLQTYQHRNPEALVSALVSDVRSCTSISHCQVLHARIIKSVNYRDGFIGDRLVSSYVKVGCAEDAQKLFAEMPEKDLVSWNSLISGLYRGGHLGLCLSIFHMMKLEAPFEPNEVTVLSMVSVCTDMGNLDVGSYIHGFAHKLGILWEAKVVNSLINMYGKSGNLGEACRLFSSMKHPGVVSWNSIIAVHADNGLAREGVGCFKKMRRVGAGPDEGTMVALLQCCENLGLVKLAESVHGLIFSCGLNGKVTIATALLDLYARLGRLNASHCVFLEIVNPDRVAWTAMLAGYAVHGSGREAIELFKAMVKRGLEPDHVTFTHLLSACSHSGLVQEGKSYFRMMSDVYGIEPRLDHYSCMVDLLGRSGLLDDAYQLIKSMPMEPNSGVWGALLGACRVHGNIGVGKEVAERLFHLEPADSRNYIMLSNIYSASRLWSEASRVRAMMKEKGLVRVPGCSFIEHGNQIHRFVVGDQTHPWSEKIHAKLEETIGKLRKAGYKSKTEFVLHDVGEEVKEDMLQAHSEKLAIAFGLLATKSGMPIVITKNLRICGDCHDMAQLISQAENCTIIIRDSKRFHHFSNGLCSCGGYW